MKSASIQWWIIGLCPMQYEAHRGVYLSRSLANHEEVRYIYPMEVTTLARSVLGWSSQSLPKDFRRWRQEEPNLYCTSRLGFILPSIARRWRMPGNWWTTKWPWGCWLMPGAWWISEWYFGRWLRREMNRCRRPSVSQVIVCLHWKLSWSLGQAPAAAIIYDCVDKFRGFPGEIPERVDWAESRLARMADAVVVSSLNFSARLQCHNPNVTHIPNGVSQELLDSLAPFVRGANLRPTAKPVIIYHGVASAWRFNWDLFLAVARLCPGYEFRLYINLEAIPKGKDVPANVRPLAWLTPRELSVVLEQSALGFMPYEIEEPTLSGFPLKMFEYFAAGLPVVSTRLPEVVRFAEHVTLCGSDPQATAALICRALNTDTSEMRSARRALAEKYSWPNLAQQYRNYLHALLASQSNR